jgi:hypothetical protein
LLNWVQISSLPDQPSYVHKLAAILAEARTPKPIPFFRRRDLKALFGLQKRQAVHLMHQIGAVRVSRELAVEQGELVRWLEQRIADPSVVAEQQRHERVIGRIVELKAETAARTIKIVLPEGASAVWPAGVSLGPGWLTVSFADEQQLLERLFLLARVLAIRPEVLNGLGLSHWPCPSEEVTVFARSAVAPRSWNRLAQTLQSRSRFLDAISSYLRFPV